MRRKAYAAAVNHEHVVEHDFEATLGDDARVELPERPRRSVARIGKERLARTLELRSESAKGEQRHENLAPQREQAWGSTAQPQGDGPNRLDVFSDAFAPLT